MQKLRHKAVLVAQLVSELQCDCAHFRRAVLRHAEIGQSVRLAVTDVDGSVNRESLILSTRGVRGDRQAEGGRGNHHNVAKLH